MIKKLNTKIVALCVSIIIILSLLTGCASQTVKTPAEPSEPSEPIDRRPAR